MPRAHAIKSIPILQPLCKGVHEQRILGFIVICGIKGERREYPTKGPKREEKKERLDNPELKF